MASNVLSQVYCIYSPRTLGCWSRGNACVLPPIQECDSELLVYAFVI